jgi:hypothetical protein
VPYDQPQDNKQPEEQMTHRKNTFDLQIPDARAAMRAKLGADKPVQQWTMHLRPHLRGGSSQV